MSPDTPTLPVPSSAPTGTIWAGPAGSGIMQNPPPTFLMGTIGAAIDKAVSGLAPGVSGGLVGIATPNGANLAIVQKIGNSFAVTAWIGKTWGPKLENQNPFDYGAEFKLTW